jgi:heme O synthase-like polyprenyltransferase
MTKSKLIWGIICLVIAGVLAVANLALPPEDLTFQIGDQNMPWVPPVVLAIVGIVLLATSSQQKEDVAQASQVERTQDPEKVALNKRMETIAWGAFLIMLGGFALVPGGTIAKGWWSIGVGVIMLGLNVARYFTKIRMSSFTTFIGLLSVVGGVAQLAGWKSLEGAFFLIIIGVYLIFKPYFDKRQLFGKAEES